MEEDLFEKTLDKVVKKIGFEESVTQVLYPFMEKIGVLWQTKKINPAQEHFISNLIRQRIIVSIAGLPLPGKKAKKALMFLPEGEVHEIGLLFFNYITRKRGINTLYLGQSVPYQDLKSVYKIHRPALLITSFISSPGPKELEKYVIQLSNDFPQSLILASGLLIRNTAFAIPRNVKTFYKASDLPALLSPVV